jgi:hypothetical protein
VAALRSAGVREVRPDDHAVVLKIWSKRYRDLGRTRTQVVCRLHAVLCELVPGGLSRPVYASHAARILRQITPPDAVAAARCELAAAFLKDLRGVDTQLRETRKKLATAVPAIGTCLTGLFGVGPVIAAAVIGDVRDVPGFPAGTTSPPATAPRRSRRPPARTRSTGCPGAGTGGSPTSSTRPRSPGSATGTTGPRLLRQEAGRGQDPKEALRALKRQISNAIFACLQADARRAAVRAKDPGGQQGNNSVASAVGSHPRHRLFGQATPGPGHHPTTAASTQRLGLPVPRAGLAIPRSLPPCRRRRRRSRWGARSEARTNDLEVRQDDGHTRPRGRPGAIDRRWSHGTRRAPHKPQERKDPRHSLTQRGIRSGCAHWTHRSGSGEAPGRTGVRLLRVYPEQGAAWPMERQPGDCCGPCSRSPSMSLSAGMSSCPAGARCGNSGTTG